MLMQKPMNTIPAFEDPHPLPDKENCNFYHSMTYPDGESVSGDWTIPDFYSYIGGVDVRNKTVLDVGTASGYLVFSAEQAGASEVTGLDVATVNELTTWPYQNAQSYKNTAEYQKSIVPHYESIRNSWWYSWHKLNSRARCVYAPHLELYAWDCTFDIVIAGAIVEHISDPVTSIGAWTKVAKETVILPFTPILKTRFSKNRYMMSPICDINNPEHHSKHNYVWWQLSEGLYRKIFENLGFDFTYVSTEAIFNIEGSRRISRPTIIAHRR